MRQLVVTGTGTGVGKTLVTAGLLRALRRADRDAVAQKPFQTGCAKRADGSLDRPDLDAIAAAAAWTPAPAELADLCPYAYEPACSPHLAARLAGEEPSVERVVGAARRLAAMHEVVLSETAGGVLVPVNGHQTMLDWMVALGWPVLVVGRVGLGTINETLLTLRAVRDAGLVCVGVVLNATGPDESGDADAYIRADNVEAIRHYGSVPVVATLPFLGGDGRTDWCRFETAFVPPILTLFGT